MSNETKVSEIFLQNEDIPKLSEEEKNKCEGKLTTNECAPALKVFADRKSPGNYELTAEFYRFFWPLVGKDLVN